MKKLLLILLFCVSNCYSSVDFNTNFAGRSLSASEMGVPDYVEAYRRGVEAGHAPAQLSQNLIQQQLQNEILAMQLSRLREAKK